MQPFIPRRLEHVAFAFLLSGIPSFLISGIATSIAISDWSKFFELWMGAYVSSWVIAFPGVLMIGPNVRRILKRIAKQDSSAQAA
ncbi:DUF2798 domain-containing protein [Thalassospira australica]|uniref:DUF2798 domain-containing protein n=1 Tax=Thalassospira australica TaxID=1528106 RepID=UPI00068DE749|nr:DUF2798 domain-containing protein [Thalassospira australica]